MNNQEIQKKWEELCAEHERAKEECLFAKSTVDQKFRSIGRNESTDNPTDSETRDFLEASEKWQDVQRRMNEFVKRYA